jgi:uncharacterized protein YjdB
MKTKLMLSLASVAVLATTQIATTQTAEACTNTFIPTIAKKAKVVKVKKIAQSKTPKALYVGASHAVKVTFNPTKPTNKKYTVTSSNKKVIKVSGMKIKALKAGKATITVKSKDGGKTHKVTVTVKAKPKTVAVKAIKQSKTPTSMTVGSKHAVKVTFNPTKPTSTVYSVASSNKSIVKVSGKTIQALKAGKATITVKSNNGRTHKVNVTVKPKTVAVTKIAHSGTPKTLAIGKSHTVKATIAPSNATTKTFSVATSNKAVVSVSGKTIKALKAGTSEITVKSSNGKKATVTVTVPKPVTPPTTGKVTGITINNLPTTMTSMKYDHKTKKKSYESVAVTTSVTPNNAKNKGVTLTSSDSSIVSVTDGKLTAKKAGKVTITAKSNDGNTTVKKTVTVKERYPNAGGDITLTPLERVEAEYDGYVNVKGSQDTSWGKQKHKDQVPGDYPYYDWYGEKLTKYLDHEYHSEDGIGYRMTGDVYNVGKPPVVTTVTENMYDETDNILTNPQATWTGLTARPEVTYEDLTKNKAGRVIESKYLGTFGDQTGHGAGSSDVTQPDITYTYINGEHYREYDKESGPITIAWYENTYHDKPEFAGQVADGSFRTFKEADNWARLHIGDNMGYRIEGSGEWRQNEKFTVCFVANYPKHVQKFLDTVEDKYGEDDMSYNYGREDSFESVRYYVSRSLEKTTKVGEEWVNDSRPYCLNLTTGEIGRAHV